VNFSEPVMVMTNGTISYDGPVVPHIETLLHEARVRHDRHILFPAVVTIQVESGSE
jgi:hypothetical protein